MNSLIALTFATFFFLASGWGFTKYFLIESLPERLGLSFLLGAGFSTLLWYLFFLLGIPFTLISFFIAVSFCTILGILISRSSPLQKRLLEKPFGKTDRILLGLIIAGWLSAFAIGNYNPITSWDSMALYDFRAKAITLNHDLRDIDTSSYYLSYPLFVSLLHTVVYLFKGVNPQGLHSLIFAAFLAVIYGRLKRWTTRRLALVGVLINLFAYEPFLHATISYANLSYMVFLVAGFLYAVDGQLLLAGLLLGLSTWVRTTEVFYLLGLLLIVWQAYRLKKLKLAILPLLVFILIKLSWSLYYRSRSVYFPEVPLAPRNLFSPGTLTLIMANLTLIREYLTKHVIQPYLGNWGVACGLFLMSWKNQQLAKARLLSLLALSSFGMTIVGTVIYSTFFPTWSAIGDSARRMLMFISPLTLTAAVLGLHQLIPRRYVK